MKFSVDEINTLKDLLPGITLGFESYDSCMQPAVIMRPVLQLLTKESTGEVDVTCNYTDYKTRVIAIIGPSTSELVPIIGKLMGFFFMPLVSYHIKYILLELLLEAKILTSNFNLNLECSSCFFFILIPVLFYL